MKLFSFLALSLFSFSAFAQQAAEKIPDEKILNCSAQVYRTEDAATAASIESVGPIKLILKRVEDFQWPRNKPEPRWMGREVVDLKNHYLLKITGSFMEHSFLGDFQQDEPTLITSARLLFTPENEGLAKSIAFTFDRYRESEDKQVQTSMLLIDSQLDNHLYSGRVPAEEAIEKGGDVDYWSLMYQYVKRAYPDIDDQDFAGIKNNVWPKVEELFFKRLNRNSVLSQVHVRCAPEKPGANLK